MILAKIRNAAFNHTEQTLCFVVEIRLYSTGVFFEEFPNRHPGSRGLPKLTCEKGQRKPRINAPAHK